MRKTGTSGERRATEQRRLRFSVRRITLCQLLPQEETYRLPPIVRYPTSLVLSVAAVGLAKSKSGRAMDTLTEGTLLCILHT